MEMLKEFKRNNAVYFLILTVLMIVSFLIACKNENSKSINHEVFKTSSEDNIYILDTLQLDTMAFIYFYEENIGYNNVIVSKGKIDSINNLNNLDFNEFIANDGFIYLDPLWGSFRESDETMTKLSRQYPKLMKDLRNLASEDNHKVYVLETSGQRKFTNEKFIKFSFELIYPKKYLFLLVKNSYLNYNFFSEDDIWIKNKDNYYSKTLVPILW